MRWASLKDDVSAYSFVRELLLDLPTLETPGIAFKFFLWDKIQPLYLAGGGRPDRIKIYTLEWKVEELRTMLEERMRAYSLNHTPSFNLLLCEDEEAFDVHRLIAYLAAGSPRDMIRLCKRIVSEANADNAVRSVCYSIGRLARNSDICERASRGTGRR